MKKIIIAALFGLAILIACAIVVASTQGEDNLDNGLKYGPSSQSRGLTQHAPIYINGNSQFAFANGVSNPYAAGTESDPYIIENWDINASSANGIEIRNANVYLIIRNCVIHDGKANSKYGIYFYNVQNSKIEDVTSYNNYHCIHLESSSNNAITNCSVYNNFRDGIRLYSSSDNQITNCALYSNSWSGVGLYESSNNNKIANCAVYNNDDGFGLFSSNNAITNCSIYNNSYGIVLGSASNNKIHYCNIYSNRACGILNSQSETEFGANATYNWWGSASGPYHPITNSNGTGDNVSDNVIYMPWLTSRWDIEPPAFTDIQAVPQMQEVHGYANITCTVTDNVAVDIVKVDITGPDGFTHINLTITRISGTNNYYHNAMYSVPGTYYYYIWAKDTSGNENKSAECHLTIKTAPAPSPVNWLLYTGIIVAVIIFAVAVGVIAWVRKKK